MRTQVTRPFQKHHDNTLAILACSTLTLSTFAGLLQSSEVTRDDGWSLFGVGMCLAVCTAGVVVAGIGMFLIEARRLIDQLFLAWCTATAALARGKTGSGTKCIADAKPAPPTNK